MDNLQSPAYPLDFPLKDYPSAEMGFTKLELASLMIAQGFATMRDHEDLLHKRRQGIATTSVMLAKAVLEEANK